MDVFVQMNCILPGDDFFQCRALLVRLLWHLQKGESLTIRTNRADSPVTQELSSTKRYPFNDSPSPPNSQTRGTRKERKLNNAQQFIPGCGWGNDE